LKDGEGEAMTKTVRKMQRGRRGERGSGVVEAALALTVFIALTAGVIDMARAMMAYSTLTHAAARAARFASVRSSQSDYPATDGEIETRAIDSATGLNPDHLTVNTTWSPNNAPGATVQVSLRYNFRPVVPLLPHDLIVLSGSSRMTVSH
jgi:Flp pilus assembly protein TadG